MVGSEETLCEMSTLFGVCLCVCVCRPLYLSTKNTILKKYDGRFMQVRCPCCAVLSVLCLLRAGCTPCRGLSCP